MDKISTTLTLGYWNRKYMQEPDKRLEIYLMVKFLFSKFNTFRLNINRKHKNKTKQNKLWCHVGLRTIWQLRRSLALEEDHRFLNTVIFANVLYATHCICSPFHVLQIFTDYPKQIVGLRLRSSPGHLPWMGARFCQRSFVRWSCGFCLLFCLYVRFHIYISIYWTIPQFLGWNLLDYGGWSFSSCIGLTLQACLLLPS